MRWVAAFTGVALTACTSVPTAAPEPAPTLAPSTSFPVVPVASSAATEAPPAPEEADTAVSERPTATVVLVGDVMLGRGVSPIVTNDPASIFEDVRYVIESADIAAGNLESPLTTRPHIAINPNALEARPEAASLLAGAGFDVMSVANNHAGDAGRESVIDTVDALAAVGVSATGGGSTLGAALTPLVVPAGGLDVAFLAFDATLAGWPAGAASAGVAHWQESAVRRSVAAARQMADVVVVSVHGGIEYLTQAAPGQERLARLLVDLGVDVVWGHGPHVIHPVWVEDGSVISTSVGNFLFDQSTPGTQTGAILEILVDAGGVVAYRAGITSHRDRRVSFGEWAPPSDDAVLLDGVWWSLVRPWWADQPTVEVPSPFRWGDVVAVGRGDVTGDGIVDDVVSFRRPDRPSLVRDQWDEHDWVDALGRTAHVGVFAGQHQIWVAGSLPRPVSEVAVCDGALGLVHTELDDREPVSTGGWTWDGFGFLIAPELAGPGTIGCADVDGDGLLDVVVDRE